MAKEDSSQVQQHLGHLESLLKCCRLYKRAMTETHLVNVPSESRAESQGCYSPLARTQSSASFGAWSD